MTRAKGKKTRDERESRNPAPIPMGRQAITLSLMNRNGVRERRAELLKEANRRKIKPLTVAERTAGWDDFPDEEVEATEEWEEF